MEPLNVGYSIPNRPPVQRKSSLGCLIKFGFLLFFVAFLVVAGIFFIYPKLTSNSIHGTLIDAVMYPDKDGKPMIWILTDGSFHYTSETKTGGSHSIESKGLFCKTYNYIYDPAQSKIISSTKTDYDNLPNIYTKTFYIRDNIWQVGTGVSSHQPTIEIYDGTTNSIIMNTQDFIGKHPVLKNGLAELRIEYAPLTFDLKTNDGLEFKYYIDGDTLYSQKDRNYTEEREFLRNLYPEVKNCFVMSTDGNQNERKNLYLLRANEFLLLEYMKKDAELKSHDIKKFSEDKKDRLQTEFGKPINVKVESSEPKLLTPDKIYLQGMIIYKDQDVAVILHQDKLGKNADRLLTCVDAEGNEKWTAPPENFPKYMMQREDKSFSDLFFMKDKFGGMRSGNIFVFKFSDFGLIGFDLETGKKLWEISI